MAGNQLHLSPSLRNIDPSAYIADNATVLGAVTIGKNSSVWYSATIRGDSDTITIGEGSNVQDGVIIHVDSGYPSIIGNGVTLGHGAIVHGATVGDNCLIAMRAVLLNGVVVGENSIVGAGAVFPEETQIPPNSLVLGVPGRVVRKLTEEQRERIKHSAEEYVYVASEYRKRFK